jgi:hypothetical protein
MPAVAASQDLESVQLDMREPAEIVPADAITVDGHLPAALLAFHRWILQAVTSRMRVVERKVMTTQIRGDVTR